MSLLKDRVERALTALKENPRLFRFLYYVPKGYAYSHTYDVWIVQLPSDECRIVGTKKEARALRVLHPN